MYVNFHDEIRSDLSYTKNDFLRHVLFTMKVQWFLLFLDYIKTYFIIKIYIDETYITIYMCSFFRNF